MEQLPYLEVVIRERSQLLRLDQIREIVAMCEAVTVDRPQDAVHAVVNIRGEIVPLIDVSETLRPLAPARFIVICHADADTVFGLVVDNLMDLVMVPTDQISEQGSGPPFARVADTLYPVLRVEDTWGKRHELSAIKVDEGDPLTAAEQKLLKSRAERYNARGSSRASDRVDYVVFERSSRSYGIDLVALREIRIIQSWCPVPGASDVCPGVVHFRGELLSLHDIAAFLAESPPNDNWRWLLIVEHEERRLGLIADDVQGISTLQRDAIRTVPIALGSKTPCFAGIADDDLLLLDPEGLFETRTFFLAA